jgi:hypothetical protein
MMAKLVNDLPVLKSHGMNKLSGALLSKNEAA